MTPRVGILLIVLVCAQAGRPTVQQMNERNTMLNRLRDAAELYRAGEAEQALRIQDEFAAGARGAPRVMVTLLPLMLDGREERLPPSLQPTVVLKPWTIAHARAFAAMQMETLLRDFVLRNSAGPGGFDEYRAEGADELLAVIAAKTHEPSAARRWELAVGLTAFSQRHLGWAGAALGFACRKHPDDSALRLACGSIEGMKAAQPADLLLQSVPQPPVPSSPRVPGRPLPAAPLDALDRQNDADVPVRLRQRHLNEAQRLLGDLVKAEPSNLEARLRLAHARIESHDDRAAATVLEPIVSGTLKPDARAEFLACLFLAGIHERAGRLDSAAALLDRAATAVPSGQTSLVARAALERARGDVAGAGVALDRLFRAPAAPSDPWRDFHRGQYWVIDPLLAALRSEARQ